MLKKSSGQIYNTYNKFLGHETIFSLALTKTEHNFNSILVFVLEKSVPPKVKKSVIWRGLKKEHSPSLKKNECNGRYCSLIKQNYASSFLDLAMLCNNAD